MVADTPKRVVIITGAAQGIGRAIATRLAKDGLDLGLFELPQCRDLLEDLAGTLRQEFGTRVVTVYGDVSVEDEVKRLVDTVVQQLGDLYAMIANAGVVWAYPLHETPTGLFEKTMDVNVKGVFFSYKYAALRMIEQGKGGRLIGAASIAGKVGIPEEAAYCASKFAVRGMTQCAAMDYAKYGITANTYAPGGTNTSLMKRCDEEVCERRGQPVGSFVGTFSNLLGRLAEPEDIAKLVSFLVSEDSAFITGQSYTVDGGTTFD
ncbi:acetoin reductase family protein [Daedaleopsis nitida]|nr:acetoin reductase family protein [Daedaleopsis nitida]